MKTYMGEGGGSVTPLILNLGNRWKWTVNLTLWQPNFQERTPELTELVSVWPQSWLNWWVCGRRADWIGECVAAELIELASVWPQSWLNWRACGRRADWIGECVAADLIELESVWPQRSLNWRVCGRRAGLDSLEKTETPPLCRDTNTG